MFDLDALSETEKQVYEAAVDALQEGITAPDFSHKFFGPQGMLAELCQTTEDRKALAKGELYRWLLLVRATALR